jgi:hypothetical protein
VPLSGPAVLDHWAALQSLLPACGRLIEVSRAKRSPSSSGNKNAPH